MAILNFEGDNRAMLIPMQQRQYSTPRGNKRNHNYSHSTKFITKRQGNGVLGNGRALLSAFLAVTCITWEG